MNGKKAKQIRRAARDIYAEKVVPRLTEASKHGPYTFAQALRELPNPTGIHRSLKRAYTRGRK